MGSRTVLATILVLGAAACSSNETEQSPGATGSGSGGTGPGGTGSSGGSGQSGSGAGGSWSGGSATGGSLDLAVPEQGFQVRTIGHTIEPGQDVEFCEVVQLPGGPEDTYYVTRLETAMAPYSHHLITEYMVPGGDADNNSSPGDIRPCFSPDAYGGDLLPVVGAQRPYRDEAFPPGVGRVFQGGSKIVVDYHSLNTSAAPILAHHAINFHTADEADIEHIARSFGFYNFGFSIPPRSQASFIGECFFDSEVTVNSLTRHTHRWGTDFSVWFAGGERDGEHVWTSDDWEGDIEHLLAGGPVQMHPGEGFRFECGFDNSEDHALGFGIKATDEMCILFGLWWSTDASSDPPRQNCQLYSPDGDGVFRE